MAALLKERREALGLTQEQLGEKLSPSVTFAAVSSWETGAKPVPKKRVAELSALLGIDFVSGDRYPKEAERDEWVLHATDTLQGYAEDSAVLVAVACRIGLDKRLAVDRGDGLEFSGTSSRIVSHARNLTGEIVDRAVEVMLELGLVEPVTDATWHFALKFAQ